MGTLAQVQENRAFKPSVSRRTRWHDTSRSEASKMNALKLLVVLMCMFDAIKPGTALMLYVILDII